MSSSKTKLINILQDYCNRLNEYLPCKCQEDIDKLNEIFAELCDKVKGCNLYFSREIYIMSGFDFEQCRYIATHSECHFVPVYDIEEHIGVKAIYNYEREVL